MVKFIDKEIVMDALEDPVEDKITGKSRWSIVHRAIIKLDEKFYKVVYQVGATEQQDEGPFEYQKTVECTEVRQVEKLVKVWEPVE